MIYALHPIFLVNGSKADDTGNACNTYMNNFKDHLRGLCTNVNVKTNNTETLCNNVDWIELAQNTTQQQSGSCKHDNEPSSSI